MEVSTHFEDSSEVRERRWLCPPRSCTIAGEQGPGLRVRMHGETDFWKRTHYDPPIMKDDGHFFYLPIEEGNQVVIETSFTLHPENQFDQAGIMVRIDADHWIKSGLEFVDGSPRLSCVVTNGFSDWSTQAWSSNTLAMRIYKLKTSYVVEAKFEDGGKWDFIRICHLAKPAGSGPVLMGLLACSPKASGGSVDFHYVKCEHTEGHHHTA